MLSGGLGGEDPCKRAWRQNEVALAQTPILKGLISPFRGKVNSSSVQTLSGKNKSDIPRVAIFPYARFTACYIYNILFPLADIFNSEGRNEVRLPRFRKIKTRFIS
jgi:hypothetical protein